MTMMIMMMMMIMIIIIIIIIIRRTCNRNTTHVKCVKKQLPVITGATGTISKAPRQYVGNVMGKHIKELHKTAILGTAQILREVLV